LRPYDLNDEAVRGRMWPSSTSSPKVAEDLATTVFASASGFPADAVFGLDLGHTV
jgi:hypothetical protein